MEESTVDLRYIHTCLGEWHKVLGILKINSSVLEILYKKLMLLNTLEESTFYDLIDSYTCEMNIYNKQKLNINTIIQDLEVTKQRIETYKPTFSQSRVIRTISAANVLNNYLFQQESKIDLCLSDIIANINKFKTHIPKISRILTVSTVCMNRNTDFDSLDSIDSLNSFDSIDLACKICYAIKLDFESKLDKFTNLSQIHNQLRNRHKDVEQRNYYFQMIINQLQNEAFHLNVLDNIDKRLV